MKHRWTLDEWFSRGFVVVGMVYVIFPINRERFTHAAILLLLGICFALWTIADALKDRT